MNRNTLPTAGRIVCYGAIFLGVWTLPALALDGAEPGTLLDSAYAGMRLASGYHVEETYSDEKGENKISGDIAGDDYDITVNSTARVCKVKGKYWTSQDNGQHWQVGPADDEMFNFLKAPLKDARRLEKEEINDGSRCVNLQQTVAEDKTVTCVELWLGPLPEPLPDPLPDQEGMPHYWIVETKSDQTWIEHVQSDETFRSARVHVDAKFTKIDEISMITPPAADAGRAPYVVTETTPGVIVVTVPGTKSVTPATPETASQIQPEGTPPPQESVRENSQGMQFVPAGTPGVWFGIWDVRVKDFQAFVAATGYKAGEGAGTKPSFTQTENDPIVLVTWNDAKAFCDWLTKKERAMGKLGSDERYRLPTDIEWSTAVGLNESSQGFPNDKESQAGVYPWGTQWPPPFKAGNYDESISHDGFEHTSPVGSFSANRRGLFDMGGNVAQWCEDVMGNDDVSVCYKTTRGGCYASDTADWCLSTGRGNGDGGRSSRTGFRVVLANQSETSLPEYGETIARNIKGLFGLIWQSELDPDPVSWAAQFAPTSHCGFKTDGAATRNDVQNDRGKLIESWPDRTYSLIGEPVYTISPDKSSARITFSYSYAYANGSKKANGSSVTDIAVEQTSNGNWLITQYTESEKHD